MSTSKSPRELIQEALGLLAMPLGKFVDRTMRGTDAKVREEKEKWILSESSGGQPVAGLWKKWKEQGHVPHRRWVRPHGYQRRSWNLGDVVVTAHVIDDWWDIVFKRVDGFPAAMGPIRRTMTDEVEYQVLVCRELLDYRNGVAHNDPIDEFQAARGLETIARILQAIGHEPEARQVHELRKPLVEKQARGGNPLGAGRRLTDSPAPPDCWCIGAHWMEPAPDLPAAWWLVAIRGNEVELLRKDQTTDEVVEYLTEKARSPTPTLIGLAYCFSTPAWYVKGLDPPKPSSFWKLCSAISPEQATTAGGLANALGHPFRESGVDLAEPLPTSQLELRATEIAYGTIPETTPSSVFRIGGSGSVGGLATLGAPVLQRISEAGVSIWPIDEAGDNTAVEIFPRGLWAAIDRLADPISTPEARAAFLDDSHIRPLKGLGGGDKETLRRERRAFDAFLTAWALSRHGGSIAERPRDDENAKIEGEIWVPQ